MTRAMNWVVEVLPARWVPARPGERPLWRRLAWFEPGACPQGADIGSLARQAALSASEFTLARLHREPVAADPFQEMEVYLGGREAVPPAWLREPMFADGGGWLRWWWGLAKPLLGRAMPASYMLRCAHRYLVPEEELDTAVSAVSDGLRDHGRGVTFGAGSGPTITDVLAGLEEVGRDADEGLALAVRRTLPVCVLLRAAARELGWTGGLPGT